MMCKTRSARLRRSVQAVAEWCRRHRHLPVKEQHAALTRRIQGHFNYFGVSGNTRSLLLLVEEVRRVWSKWLRRRSQQAHLTWEKFGLLHHAVHVAGLALLAQYPHLLGDEYGRVRHDGDPVAQLAQRLLGRARALADVIRRYRQAVANANRPDNNNDLPF